MKSVLGSSTARSKQRAQAAQVALEALVLLMTGARDEAARRLLVERTRDLCVLVDALQTGTERPLPRSQGRKVELTNVVPFPRPVEMSR